MLVESRPRVFFPKEAQMRVLGEGMLLIPAAVTVEANPEIQKAASKPPFPESSQGQSGENVRTLNQQILLPERIGQENVDLC